MATIQKRGISLLLVLVLMLGMIPSVSAAEIDTQPSTEPAETTTPVTEETLATETSPPETTQPEETSPPETTEPEQTAPAETVPEETEPEEESEPMEESSTEETQAETAPEEELSLSLMSLDDGVATIADTKIVGAPNAFANVFLLNGGIDIPSFDHVQHKEHLPLYSVYLKDQPGYENNYYVAYCIEPGVVLGESGGHTGSSTTVGGMTDGTGALEWLSREQVEAMGIVLLYGQREIARRADDESVRLEKLARHAATQVLIWEIASGWRSATPPYTRYDSTFYDAIVPPLECAVQVWGTKFYLDGIDDAYNEIVAQMEQHYKIPSFMKSSKSSAPTYELIADGNGKYSITLTDTNNILSQYTFTNTSDLTFSVSGNKLTVTANGPISDTLVAPTKQVPNLDSQVFYVWEYKEQQKLMSCKTEPANSPMPAYFYVTAPDQTASLDLTKTTEDGKKLSGWKFGIYSDSGCSNLISGPHTTDAKGKISVADLTAGTVYVKELGHTDSTINALYSCDSTNPQKVVLIAGETATVSFHNRLNTGDVKLVKQTNTGKNLVGWLIGLYYDSACTKPVSGSPFTTGTNGTITVSGLKPGTLYAKEIPTDDPYWEFDTAVKEVKIVANQTATVTFTNTHFGRIKFQKTTNTGNHLGGWTFRVTDAKGNHVGDYTTDENGEAYTGNLPLGRYIVQELSVDDDYWNCELGFHDVTVKAGETVVDEWKNKEQGLGWFRKTTNTGENLSGWEITVYSDEACTQKVCTVITDETGKAGHYLDPGIFYTKESGDTLGRFEDEYWLIDKTVYRFEIKPHEETTVTFSNTHYGKFNIRKTMDTDGPLDGWQFRVTDASGKEIAGSPFTSDKNGEIHVGNILPGVYKIEELIPDDSLYYCKSENPQTVTVKQGETAEVSFINALRPGKITIEKVDLKGEHLSDAKFAKPETWPSFLTTACHNFRLSFDKQVLLYAQRPDATAVLPIEGKHGWNQRFGRWVNRGSKGIALFDSDRNGQATLKYYFDIADTHEGLYPRPVPIWTVQPEHGQAIIETLENHFGELERKDTLAAALISAAQNAVEDNAADYLAELIYYKEDSNLQFLDEENIEALFKPLLQNSIAYMLMVRCGIDPAEHFQRDDFSYISGFNTMQTLNALGTATSDISQMCLSEIARTVLPLQRQEMQNRTFAQVQEDEYAITVNKETHIERSIDHDSNHIQQAGRLLASQPSPAPAADSSPWEVRIDAQPVSEGASEGHIHESDDQRQTEPSPAGDRADRQDEDRADGVRDGESQRSERGTESHRPDEVGGTDEQPQGIGGGADSGGTDLRIEQEPAAPTISLTADPELPPLLEERFITAILENRDDDLKSPKKEIQNFFRENYEQNKRAEYLKAVYPDRFTELMVDGTRIGYKATDDGLLMWEGAYLSRTKESVFSWGIVAELTSNLIDQGTYFFNPKVTPPPSYEDQQISFMEGGYLAPEPEDDQQFTFFSQPELPQQVIDEALCIGFNDRDSRLIICAYFMKDKPLEDNAAFLQKKYGTNGAGLFINDREYAVWYDPEGIRVSSGRSAQKRHATLIPWTQAAKRIRELLDLGRYMPQSELDRVQDFERRQIADSLIYARREFSEAAREAGYAPLTTLAYSVKGGFPESEAQMQKLLEDPATLSQLVDEWTLFAAAHASDRSLLRSRWQNPKAILQRLEDLQREPIIYTAAEGFEPQRKFYISDDELDKLVLSGGGDYRLDVYAFFANHSDTKERKKYLSHCHGEYSGSHNGNDNTTYTYKQLHFSHGGISNPHAQVTLTWNKVLRRVESLMQSGKWLSEADRAAMGDYELKQLARTIHRFFYDVPDTIPRPSNRGFFEFTESVTDIQQQLEDPNRVREIYETMMLPAWEQTEKDSRHYNSRKAGLEAMIAYRAGTYSVFGRNGPIKPLPEIVETEPLPEPKPIERTPLETAKHLINSYCQEVFGQNANYDDLSHVDLAYGSTSDNELTVEIFADLNANRLVYQVGYETVHEVKCDSLQELNEYLANLDFDEMIAHAEEQFKAIYQVGPESELLEEQIKDAPIVARYLSDEERIVIQQYPSGEYHIRYGFDEERNFANSTAGGFSTLEEAEATLRSHRPAAAPVADFSEPEQSMLAPPQTKPKREHITFEPLYPNIPREQRHNFQIDDLELGYGTPTQKYAANVAAIQCLKQIESEGRLATPDEQEILSQYVGWGGLSHWFDDRHPKYQELKDLLEYDEYVAARESSLTAFYTSPVIIRAMYQALYNMGFREGNILEPACGIGNFIGMLPNQMARSHVYGVELDSISGRIAQQLYQNSSIAVTGFEKVQMPDSFFDVAIGNVPFGDFKVLDKRYDKHHWLIHDYFFGKTLDKVRPGGIVAFITSKGTMDKENSSVRKYLAQRADLIGAIRLPNTAFKANAGTEVTSDILFLQKRDRMTDIEPDWVHLDTDPNGIRMNSYFVQHPEMILGEMVMESSRYGMESTCRPYPDKDLGKQLQEAVATLQGQITEYQQEELEEEDNSIPADPNVRNFSYTIVDGKVYFRENSRMNPVELSLTAENRIRGMIALRDCVRKLIDYQTEGYSDEDIQKEQSHLNTLYDDYTKKYGLLSSRGNNLAFSEDSSYFLLCSLEVLDEEGNFKRKADMFTKRTIRPHVAVTSVDTASEALAVSISEKARVDMPFMAELSGKTEEELEVELAGVIFREIRCAESKEDIALAHADLSRYPFVTADEYLSGNVRRKLRMVKALQEVLPEEQKPSIQQNITALEAVQPVDLTAGEIGVRIGVNWVPKEVYEQFMYEVFGTSAYARGRIKVLYSPHTGEWNVTSKSMDGSNIKAVTTYGTQRINAYHIFEQTLNQKDVRIFDTRIDAHGNEVRVLNKKETAIAQDRQELIKAKFAEWIWKDIDRRERLCGIYNETFNALRPREYDGQHIRFSGMNPEISLRTHQINAIAHIMYGGNTLLAHEVGAGKTFEMVAAAMESKRLGLCTKSLIVVPNHITEQWAAEWLQLYPSANILVATKKDFETKNRKKFCARIATGDYDAIIIGHSQFEKIPMSAERQQQILRRQIDSIMDGIREAKRSHAENYTIKQMERTRKSLEARLTKLNDQSRKDSVVTFEQLGVDRIFVDESHYFKNCAKRCA